MIVSPPELAPPVHHHPENNPEPKEDQGI